MGFLYLAIRIPKAITFTFVINMAYNLKFTVMGALSHLGLFKPPPEEDYSLDTSANYVLILDGSSPSLVPVSVHVLTATIKKKLPILTYSDFIGGGGEEEVDQKKMTVCTVCLECIEGTHEIREPVNCNHVFHRDCLDTWVDQGQVTCPLCRSMLLPPKQILSGSSCYGAGGVGVTEGGNPAGPHPNIRRRDAHLLLGEGHDVPATS